MNRYSHNILDFWSSEWQSIVEKLISVKLCNSAYITTLFTAFCLNSHRLDRHLLVRQNSEKRGVYEQQTISRKIENWKLKQITKKGHSVARAANRLSTTTHSLYAWIKKYSQTLRNIKLYLLKVITFCDLKKSYKESLKSRIH